MIWPFRKKVKVTYDLTHGRFVLWISNPRSVPVTPIVVSSRGPTWVLPRIEEKEKDRRRSQWISPDGRQDMSVLDLFDGTSLGDPFVTEATVTVTFQVDGKFEPTCGTTVIQVSKPKVRQ